MGKIRFTFQKPGCDREFHVSPDDLLVVLNRLPEHTWSRLDTIHLKDGSWGGRRLGNVTETRRDITLHALPPRLSFSRFLVPGETCGEYGAERGRQWPKIAIRRFLLYDVFLHEIGHLQKWTDEERERWEGYAGEKYAQRFADRWRRKLWAEHFEHPDPVHNKP